MQSTRLIKVARLAVLMVALSAFSCARGKTVIVLLPGADGKTGQIVVTNKGGSQLLDKPGQATAIESADISPSAPFKMDDSQVKETFGEAVSALPPAPIHFTLYFRNASAELTPGSLKQLARILPTVVSRRSTDISIVGHTDRVGTRSSNFALAADRAYKIRDILLARGLDPKSIEVASHGEGNPLIATADEVPEPRNRRVEVIVR
jgi:outer membrane protein OmpA-like peptidoglycan-associated protein